MVREQAHRFIHLIRSHTKSLQPLFDLLNLLQNFRHTLWHHFTSEGPGRHAVGRDSSGSMLTPLRYSVKWAKEQKVTTMPFIWTETEPSVGVPHLRHFFSFVCVIGLGLHTREVGQEASAL